MIKFLVLILSFSALANTKKIMGDIVESYTELIPYMTEGKTYLSPAEKKKISYHLNRLQQSFKKSKHTQYIKEVNFAPSLKIIQEDLRDIQFTFDRNDHLFTRHRLRELTSACISCHSQLPADRFPKVSYLKKISPNDFNSSFDYAMMLTLFRDYQGAIKAFEKEIQVGLKRQSYRNIMDRSFLNILRLYLKNLKDPKGAMKFLNKYKNNSYLYPRLNQLMLLWIEGLKSWKNLKKSYSGKEIDLLIKTKLAPLEGEAAHFYSEAKTVDLLTLSGIFSHYLVSRPKGKRTPEILYWLGKIENRFDRVYLHNLGDLYLKECIRSYSKKPVAKRCYKALEQSTLMGFTGSGGTFLPASAQKELDELKKLLR